MSSHKFLQAAKSGDLGKVQSGISSSRVDVNFTDRSGYSALAYAAQQGHEEVVCVLISASADLNPLEQETPLCQAALRGHERIFDLLINARADINFNDNHGWTPLSSAARRGRLKLVNKLLASGAEAGDKALQFAIQSDKEDVIRSLKLWKGNPVIWAAGFGDRNTLKPLLNAGSDVNQAWEGGDTALSVACYFGRTSNVKLLLDQEDIFVNLPSPIHNQQTPIIIASLRGYADIVEMLVKHPEIDVNTKDSDGQTALLVSCVESRLACVDALLASTDIKVNIPNSRMQTPLQIAFSNNNFTVVRSLLKHPDIVVLQGKKDTPFLLQAIEANEVGIALNLIDQGADVDAINKEKSSAMMEAIKRNQVPIIRNLVAHKASVLHVNEDNKTAMHYAIEATNLDAIIALLQGGQEPDLNPVWAAGMTLMNKNGDSRIVDAVKEYYVVGQARFINFADLSHVKQIAESALNVTFSADYVIATSKYGPISTPVVCKRPFSDEDSWFELQVLQGLPSHPNVISFVGVCTGFVYAEQQQSALVLPYKRGGELRQFLDRRKAPLPLQRMIDISVAMGSGVHHLHENGYKHCDLTANNFLLTEPEDPNGSPNESQLIVLSDFGLSRPASHVEKGHSMVAWRWSSIETLKSSGQDTSIKSDVYMFGMTLWEIALVSVLPFFWIESLDDLLGKIGEADVIPFMFPKHVSEVWKSLVIKCTQVDPLKRPHMEEVLKDLADMRKDTSSGRVEMELEEFEFKGDETSQEDQFVDTSGVDQVVEFKNVAEEDRYIITKMPSDPADEKLFSDDGTSGGQDYQSRPITARMISSAFDPLSDTSGYQGSSSLAVSALSKEVEQLQKELEDERTQRQAENDVLRQQLSEATDSLQKLNIEFHKVFTGLSEQIKNLQKEMDLPPLDID